MAIKVAGLKVFSCNSGSWLGLPEWLRVRLWRLFGGRVSKKNFKIVRAIFFVAIPLTVIYFYH